jgi:ABC-type sugar transport system permease subunit
MYLYNSFRDPGRPQNVTIAGALLVMILIMVINIIVFKTVRSEKSGE